MGLVNNRCFYALFILLWGIYALHWNNMKFSIVESVSSLILGVNLLFSFVFFISCCYQYRFNSLFKMMTILMLVFSLYGLVSIVGGETIKFHNSGVTLKNGTYMIAFLRSFLPIFAFFFLTRKGVLNFSMVRISLIFFSLLFFFVYFRSVMLHSLVSDKKEFVNNVGYIFLSLLPGIYLIKKSFYQYIAWAILLAFIFSALKRGPIVISSFLLAIFLYQKFTDTPPRYKVYALLGIVVIIVICGYFIVDYYNSSALFRIRLEKTLAGNTSGRNVIINDLLELYNYHTSLFEYFFGLGADATVRFGLNYAHNDWVEILIDQGIFGVTLYLVFWFVAFRQVVFMKNKTCKYICLFIFVDLFLRTIFSMTYSMIQSVTCLLLGYAIAADEDSKELVGSRIYRQ